MLLLTHTNESGKVTYMGRADIITKDYIKCLDIFTDVFNQLLYHGRQQNAWEIH